MRTSLRSGQIAEARSGLRRFGVSRAGDRFRSAVETGALAGLLLAIVASAVVESPAALLCAIVVAWFALAVIVGLRNVLDAGCFFMLVVVGVILVVDLATNGPASLLH